MELLRRLLAAEGVGYSVLQARPDASGTPSDFKESPWGMVAYYGVLAVFGYAFYRRSMSHAEEVQKKRRKIASLGGKTKSVSWAVGLDGGQIERVNTLFKDSLRKLESLSLSDLKGMLTDFQDEVVGIVGEKSPAVQASTDHLLGEVLVELHRKAGASEDTPEGREKRADYLARAQHLAIENWHQRIYDDAFIIAKGIQKRGTKLPQGATAEQYATEISSEAIGRILEDLPKFVESSRESGVPLFDVVRKEVPRAVEKFKGAFERGGLTGFTFRYDTVKSPSDIWRERYSMGSGGSVYREMSFDEIAPGVMMKRRVVEKKVPGVVNVVSYLQSSKRGDILALAGTKSMKVDASSLLDERIERLRQIGKDAVADDLEVEKQDLDREIAAIEEEIAKIQSLERATVVFPDAETAENYAASLRNRDDVMDVRREERKSDVSYGYGDPEYFLTFTETRTEDVDDDARARHLGLTKSAAKRREELELKKVIRLQSKIAKLQKSDDPSEEALQELMSLQSQLSILEADNPKLVQEIKKKPRKVLEEALQDAQDLTREEEEFLSKIEDDIVKKGDARYPKIRITKKVDEFYEVKPEVAERYRRATTDAERRAIMATVVMKDPTPEQIAFFVKRRGEVPPGALRNKAVFKDWSEETKKRAEAEGIELPSENAFTRVEVLGRQPLALDGDPELRERTLEQIFQRRPNAVFYRPSGTTKKGETTEAGDWVDQRRFDEIESSGDELEGKLEAASFAAAVEERIEAQSPKALLSRSRAFAKYPDLIQMFQDPSGEIDEEGLDAFLRGDMEQIKKGRRNEGRAMLVAAERERLKKDNPAWGEKRLATEAEGRVQKRISTQLDALSEDLDKSVNTGSKARRIVENVLARPDIQGKTYFHLVEQWVAEEFPDQYGKRRPGKDIFSLNDVRNAAYEKVRQDLDRAQAALEDESLSDTERLNAENFIEQAATLRVALESEMEPDREAIDALKDLNKKIMTLSGAIAASKIPEKDPRLLRMQGNLDKLEEERERLLIDSPYKLQEIADQELEAERRQRVREVGSKRLQGAYSKWAKLYEKDLASQGLLTPAERLEEMRRLRQEAIDIKRRFEQDAGVRTKTVADMANQRLQFDVVWEEGDKTPGQFLREMGEEGTYSHRIDRAVREAILQSLDEDPNALELANEYNMTKPLGEALLEDPRLRGIAYSAATNDIESAEAAGAVDEDYFQASKVRKLIDRVSESEIGINELTASRLGHILRDVSSPQDFYDPAVVDKTIAKLESPFEEGSYLHDLEEELSERGSATGYRMEGEQYRLGRRILTNRKERNRVMDEVTYNLLQGLDSIYELERMKREDPANHAVYDDAIQGLRTRMEEAEEVRDAAMAQDYFDLLQNLETLNRKNPQVARDRALPRLRFKWGAKELNDVYDESRKKLSRARDELREMTARYQGNIPESEKADHDFLLQEIRDAERKILGVKSILSGTAPPRDVELFFKGAEPTIALIADKPLLKESDFERAYEVVVESTNEGIPIETDKRLADLAYRRFSSTRRSAKDIFEALRAKIRLDEARRTPAARDTTPFDLKSAIESLRKKIPDYRGPMRLSPETLEAQRHFLEVTRNLEETDLPLVRALNTRKDIATGETETRESYLDPFKVAATSATVFSVGDEYERETKALLDLLERAEDQQDLGEASRIDIQTQMLLDPRVKTLDPELEEQARNEILAAYTKLNEADRKYFSASQALKNIDAAIEQKKLVGSVAAEKKFKKGGKVKTAPKRPEKPEDYFLIRGERIKVAEQMKRDYESAKQRVARLIPDETIRQRLLSLFQQGFKGRDQEEREAAKKAFQETLKMDLPESSDVRVRVVRTPSGIVQLDESSGPTNVLREVAKNLKIEQIGASYETSFLETFAKEDLLKKMEIEKEKKRIEEANLRRKELVSTTQAKLRVESPSHPSRRVRISSSGEPMGQEGESAGRRRGRSS